MVQVKNMKQRSYIMLYFENDYCEGAHEAILKRLMETNLEKVPGYGQDPFCDKAKEKIKEAEIHSAILGSDHCPVMLEIEI